MCAELIGTAFADRLYKKEYEMIQENILELVKYGLSTGLVDPEDKVYTINRLLELFQVDEIEDAVFEKVENLPACTIGDHCRVGDFVEVKNSVIGDGTKISHLTYVGDSDVGQRVNFGCGTVTTNYDGHKKFRCTIGDDVFLGCNTNLIAPVTVGDRAYTAAGSTVTDDVPDGALAIARTRQTNKPGWADRLHSLWKKDK